VHVTSSCRRLDSSGSEFKLKLESYSRDLSEQHSDTFYLQVHAVTLTFKIATQICESIFCTLLLIHVFSFIRLALIAL